MMVKLEKGQSDIDISLIELRSLHNILIAPQFFAAAECRFTL
jgi:hypothetical protein